MKNIKDPIKYQEMIKKMSLAKTGKSRPDMRGDKNPMRNPEIVAKAKKKMSEAKKGKPRSGNPQNWKHNAETKKKMSLRKKGKKLSEEHSRKISESLKGITTWNKGLKKETDERLRKYGEKISEAIKGEKNPNWQGGKSFEPYSVDWTETLKRAIRERNNYICQLCNQYGNEVHHIDYDKKNCNSDNLITLCKSCHRKTNFNREYWINYFLNLKT